MNPFLKNLLASSPDLVRPHDVKVANELNAALNLFTSHRSRNIAAARRALLTAAQKAYEEHPSDEAYYEMERRYVEMNQFGGGLTDRELIQPIKRAELKLQREQILPWLRPIWQRAVAFAEAKAKKVRADEAKRILELTGSPMTHSDLVDAATAAVAELNEVGKVCQFIDGEELRPRKDYEEEHPIRDLADQALRTPADWMLYLALRYCEWEDGGVAG